MASSTKPDEAAVPESPAPEAPEAQEEASAPPARKMTIEQLRRVGDRISEAERWLKEHLRLLRR
jgi:hypothetical protein